MSGCGCEVEITHREQRRVLIALLAINAAMFVVELAVGWVAESAGLIADSLDMLADAAVYGLSLYAVGHAVQRKARAAYVSGIFQIALAAGVAIEVLRRLLWGSEPQSLLIIAVGALALAANVACLLLIARHRQGEVHMRASWVFSKNDVIANLGVIGGGLLVYLTGSRIPDLLIGAAITVIVLRGGIHIVRDARGELEGALSGGCGGVEGEGTGP